MAKNNDDGLQPTHRHNAAKGWEYFNHPLGRWEKLETRPTQKLARKHSREGWQYFADPDSQPAAYITLSSSEITAAEREVIARMLADTTLTLDLMTKISPDLPAIPGLRDVRDYIAEFLKHNFWLEEK